MTISFTRFYFFRTDPNKNKLALDVISHLVTNCYWLNVHIVPPHGEVFEIRIADGYGARWSKDGSKVCVYMYVLIRIFFLFFIFR